MHCESSSSSDYSERPTKQKLPPKPTHPPTHLCSSDDGADEGGMAGAVHQGELNLRMNRKEHVM